MSRITSAEIRTIKRILSWPERLPFPRCRAKSGSAVKKLAAQGDTIHGKSSHAPCDLCRCQKTAGSGTRGNFYGLGEHTGHLGVGYCVLHENSPKLKRIARKAAEQHMEALQLRGNASIVEPDYIDKVNADAKDASTRADHRAAMSLVTKTLEEWQAFTEKGGKLTEAAGGKVIDMTDKSRMELGLKIATTLSKLKLDEFKLSAAEYIHIDDLLIRIPQMIALIRRYVEREKDQENFIKDFKMLWTNVPTGGQNKQERLKNVTGE